MRIHAFHRLFKQRLSEATKPFNARGAKIKRCLHCQVKEEHCLCHCQPDVDTELSVLMLVSDNEIFKPSNTGRLIADVVKDTHVYQWHRTEPQEEMMALLSNPMYQPVVVFPEEYVEDKTRVIDNVTQWKEEGKRPLLIFLDGSWREARRIFRKSPYLTSLPVISIKPDSVSQYLMRKSDNENHLSTAEVASLVIDQFGENAAAKVLELWFETFRESYLLSKTRLKPDLSKPALKRFSEHMESAKRV